MWMMLMALVTLGLVVVAAVSAGIDWCNVDLGDE